MRSDAAQSRFQIACAHLYLRPTIKRKIHELRDGGLDPYEIAKHTELPVAVVRAALLVRLDA